MHKSPVKTSKIILVDDDPSSRLLITEILEGANPDDLDRFFSVLKTMVDGDWPADFTFRVCLPEASIQTIRCIVGKMDDECGDGYDVIGVCYQLQ